MNGDGLYKTPSHIFKADNNSLSGGGDKQGVNPPQGGGNTTGVGTNNPQGDVNPPQGRVNIPIPPINPSYPNGQLLPDGGYNTEGSNQPLARNISDELENLSKTINYHSLSKSIFSRHDGLELFMIEYLLHNDRATYNKVAGPTGEHIDNLKWWAGANSKILRAGLRGIR